MISTPVNEETTGDVRTMAFVIPVKTGMQTNDDVYILASKRNGTLYIGVTSEL
jgi:hypothetical protein